LKGAQYFYIFAQNSKYNKEKKTFSSKKVTSKLFSIEECLILFHLCSKQ